VSVRLLGLKGNDFKEFLTDSVQLEPISPRKSGGEEYGTLLVRSHRPDVIHGVVLYGVLVVILVFIEGVEARKLYHVSQVAGVCLVHVQGY